MTCFISEQLSRRMNLSLGDRIEVPTPGGNWPLTIAGIYADYGNPKGQVAVNAAALFAHFPEVPQTRMALRVEPGKVAGADHRRCRHNSASTAATCWIRPR